MARVTVEKAVGRISNRFDLTLCVAIRARELSKGHLPKVTCHNRWIVVALREIEANKIGIETLRKLNKN